MTRNQTSAWAVVRLDDFFSEPLSVDNVADRVTITKVLLDEDAADAEAKRLNSLAAHGVSYFVQCTRLR